MKLGDRFAWHEDANRELRLTIVDAAVFLHPNPGSNRPTRYRVTSYDDELGFPDSHLFHCQQHAGFPLSHNTSLNSIADSIL